MILQAVLRDVPDAWTAARVQARMAEAMRTLRMVSGAYGPNRKITYWPDVVHAVMDAYGYTPEVGTMPKASPRDIRRMNEVLGWISQWLSRAACAKAGLVEDTGRVLTSRAMGWTYAKIGRRRRDEYLAAHRDFGPKERPRLPGGNSRPSLVTIERKGLSYVATQLNLSGVPVDQLAA